MTLETNGSWGFVLPRTQTYDRGPQTARSYAVCPSCLRELQLSKNGTMGRHGWNAHNVQHGTSTGWHTGPCNGHKMAPLNQTDRDGITESIRIRKIARELAEAAFHHENVGSSSYIDSVRERVGRGEGGYVKAAAFVAKVEGIEGIVISHHHIADHYVVVTVYVSRDYRANSLPGLSAYETLRMHFVKGCRHKSAAADYHANDIEKAMKYHATHDTTPLIPGPKPDSQEKIKARERATGR